MTSCLHLVVWILWLKISATNQAVTLSAHLKHPEDAGKHPGVFTLSAYSVLKDSTPSLGARIDSLNMTVEDVNLRVQKLEGGGLSNLDTEHDEKLESASTTVKDNTIGDDTLALCKGLEEKYEALNAEIEALKGLKDMYEATTNEMNAIQSEVTMQGGKIKGLKDMYEATKNEMNAIQSELNMQGGEIKENTALLSKMKCYSGDVLFSSVLAQLPDWPMRKVFVFPEPFEKQPIVTFGITNLDSYAQTNLRVKCQLESVTMHDLAIKCQTWGDHGLYSVAISWLACNSI